MSFEFKRLKIKRDGRCLMLCFIQLKLMLKSLLLRALFPLAAGSSASMFRLLFSGKLELAAAFSGPSIQLVCL